MDEDERGPAGKLAVPEESSGEAGIVPQANEQSRVFSQALQVHFETGGLSQRQFAARYPHYHHSAVSEFLSAEYLPELDFVDKVLETVEASYGSPVTEETRQHLYDLHMAAAEAIGGIPHRIRVLTDELRVQVVHREQAQEQVHALVEALADRRAEDEQVRARMRELQNAANVDQIRYGAELAHYQGENESLREELDRLKAAIAALEGLLKQAEGRRILAEQRCKDLEHSLLDAEGTAEQERLAQALLREAEEREQSRQAEQQRLQQALDKAHQQAAVREKELQEANLAAADRVRAAEGQAQRRAAELAVYKAADIRSSLKASEVLVTVEVQALSLLAAGATYAATAEQLAMTEPDLEAHLAQIAKSLQVSVLGEVVYAADGTRSLSLDLNEIRSLLDAAKRRRTEQQRTYPAGEVWRSSRPSSPTSPRGGSNPRGGSDPGSGSVPRSSSNPPPTGARSTTPPRSSATRTATPKDQPPRQVKLAKPSSRWEGLLLTISSVLGLVLAVAYGWLAGGHGVHFLGLHPGWGGGALAAELIFLWIVFGSAWDSMDVKAGRKSDRGACIAAAGIIFFIFLGPVLLISMVFHLVAPGESAVFLGIEHFSRTIRGWSLLQF